MFYWKMNVSEKFLVSCITCYLYYIMAIAAKNNILDKIASNANLT